MPALPDQSAGHSGQAGAEPQAADRQSRIRAVEYGLMQDERTKSAPSRIDVHEGTCAARKPSAQTIPQGAAGVGGG